MGSYNTNSITTKMAGFGSSFSSTKEPTSVDEQKKRPVDETLEAPAARRGNTVEVSLM